MRFVMLACVVVAAGCDSSGNTAVDAAGDGRVDDAAIDAPAVDASACGADRFFTGELLDWDSTTGSFLGVFEARYTVRNMPAKTATTAPNGRIELCIPAAGDVLIDVDAPGDYTDAVYLVDRNVAPIPMVAFSARTFTTARRTTFYASIGAGTFDVTRGHVLVYQAIDRAQMTLTGANGPAVATDDGASWAAGTEGRYVLFSNVEVGIGAQALGGPSTMIGRGPIPIAAGKLTFLTTVFALE